MTASISQGAQRPVYRPAPSDAAEGPALSYLSIVIFLVLVSTVDLVVVSQDQAPVTVWLLEILVWLAFVAILVNELTLGHIEIVRVGWKELPELYGYVAWATFSVIIALGVNLSGDTVGKLKNILPAFLFFHIMLRAIRSREQAETVLWFYIAALLVNAVFGILQYATEQFYPIPPLFENSWKADFSGQFLDNTANGLQTTPNNFASMIMPGIIFLCVMARYLVRDLTRLLLISIPLALLVAGLYVSQSKGGLLWCAIGTAVALAPIRRGRLALGLLVALGVTALVTLYGVTRADDSSIDVSTTVVRVMLWQTAFDIVTGNNFVSIFGDAGGEMRYWTSLVGSWYFPNAHNTWINQIILFGIPGFLLYAAVWWKALRRICDPADDIDPRSALMLRGIFGSLIGLAGMCVFEPREDGVSHVVQLSFLFGLGIAISRLIDLQRRASMTRIDL